MVKKLLRFFVIISVWVLSFTFFCSTGLGRKHAGEPAAVGRRRTRAVWHNDACILQIRNSRHHRCLSVPDRAAVPDPGAIQAQARHNRPQDSVQLASDPQWNSFRCLSSGYIRSSNQGAPLTLPVLRALPLPLLPSSSSTFHLYLSLCVCVRAEETQWREDVNSKVVLANNDPIPCMLLANKASPRVHFDW